jgi:hypothetical protein
MTLVNGEAISNLDENGKDGKDIELEYLKNQSWLSSTLGWDFENVWKMSANGFPRLKMQEEEFVPIEDAIIVDINSISNVYTGQPQAPAVSTISRRTPVLEYKIKDAPEDTYAPEKPVNAGSYTLKATLLNSGLYAAASKEQDFNITPKEITVVANGGSSTYGDNPANPKFTATGLVEGETVDLLTGLNNNFALNAASDVGRYSLYVTGTLTNSNYFINERHDAYWDIYSKAITITANNITKNANELDGINFTYNINPPLINNDQMSGALVCNYEEREGVYTIHQGNLTAGANYTITYVPGTLTVITIEDAITIASIYLLYTGQPQTPTVSATSGRTPVLEYKIRDAPEDTYTSEKPVNAGDYTLKAILPNEGGYAAAGKEQDFNISPKAITVTVKIGSSTYGDNPANPKFTATGLVEGETVDLLTGLSNSFAINATTPSGIYPLYVIGTLTNSNYFINERHDAYWLVYSKPITITANNITKNANELDGINFTYNINPPLINNDQMSGALVCNYEEREGVYTIYQGSLTVGPNYTITYVPGTLTTTTASAIDDYISNDNIIQIYPNPVNTGELFTLITNIAVNDLRDSKILLYNTIGNLVSGFSMTNSMMNLFAPNQKGHYIVKIVTKNGSQSTKLIVK